MINYSFKTNNTYGERYLQIDLKQELLVELRQSIVTGTITVVGKGEGDDSSSSLVTTGPTTVFIGGQVMFSREREEGHLDNLLTVEGSVIDLEEITVEHDDAGLCILATSISTALNSYTISTTNGGNWILDECGQKIVVPEVAPPTVSAVTETTASINFSILSDGGEDVHTPIIRLYETIVADVSLQEINSYSGAFVNLTPGTTYYVGAEVENSAGVGYSIKTSFTTASYPYLTEINLTNLIADYEQKITFYNPLEREVTLQMHDVSTDVVMASVTTTGTTWSFSLNSSQMATYLGQIKTSAPAKYVLLYGGISSVRTGYIYSLNTSITSPEWLEAEASIQYRDTQGSIISLTGSDQIIVQNKSEVEIKLVNPEAHPAYGAEVVDYQVSFNSTKDADYVSLGADGSGTYTIPTEKITSVENIIRARAVDSRGEITEPVAKSIPTLAYFEPVCSLTVKRANGYGTTILPTLNVTWAIGDLNANMVQYRTKTSSSSSYGSWSTTLTTSGYGTGSSYDIQARATDVLGGVGPVATATLKAGSFPLFIDVNKDAIGVGMMPTAAGIYTADKIYTSTSGGFWESSYRVPITIIQSSQPSSAPSARDVIWIDSDS